MDVDLDERYELADCARCTHDAEAFFYRPDHALLRGGLADQAYPALSR